jgi:D-alanyl-D-alanine carboxypeptidase
LKYSPLATLTLGLLLAAPLTAADRPADEVTRSVRAEMGRQHIPGLALLVTRKGQIIRAEGYGLANVELNVPVKPETIFQSGSVGTSFRSNCDYA